VSSEDHRLRFSRKLASHLENQEAGDIVFAFKESTETGDSQDPSPEYKCLYAWKHCLMAGNDDCYFAKRFSSPSSRLRIEFTSSWDPDVQKNKAKKRCLGGNIGKNYSESSEPSGSKPFAHMSPADLSDDKIKNVSYSAKVPDNSDSSPS
jgi:hypothetical protein